MSDYLQQIVYLTQSDYDILAQGTEENPRSVTKNGITLTNLDENCLYITDGGVVSSDISGVINVSHGGTGNETFLSGQVLVGNGENPITTIIKTSANTANTLVERDANGDFSAGTITMTQGNIGSMTLSGTAIAALTTINTSGGNGLLAYKPTDWTGVSSSQWGVGTVDLQGVIRSNSQDLLHSRGGTNYVILDAENYSNYALPYKGNVTALGSGSPSATVKTWWENTTNVPKLGVLAAYNNSGSEKTMIFSKGNADKQYGTVLAWGYGDRYIRILRKNNADSWISSDWEKIDAGNADTATAIQTAGTTAQFYRGDNSWSNIIQQTANAALGIDTDLKIGTVIKDLHFSLGSGSGTDINSGNAGGITFGAGYTSYGGIYWQTSGSYGSRIHFATTNSFANGAYTRMIITSDGKVGIGTLTPSYKLSVNGDISATNFRGDLIGKANALANLYTSSTRPTDANITHVVNGGVVHFKATSSMTSNKPVSDGHILHFHWDDGAWNSQLYVPTRSTNPMQYRASSAAGTWDSWRTLLDSNNYTDYTVTKTGSGASGSWGIDITGTAAKATADASGNTITTTYAPLASPTFTGTPKAPTAANGTSTTQIATTEFVNNTLAYANAMTFKGTLGTGGTITSLPASHNAGDTYRVITAGTWAGKYCEVGTLIICITDGTAANDAHWTSVETNEDGAVVGPTSSTDNAIVRFNGSTGRVVQNSKTTIDDYGYITLNHTAGHGNEIEVKYGTDIDFWIGIGNGNENHGIYDAIASKWVLSAGLNNVWSFNGTALSANTAAALSAAPTITSGGTATVNLSANTAYTLTVGGKSVIFKTPADANTDTKVNYSLAATTKAYLMASSDAPTSTATAREAKGDSNVYLTATAGELSAVRHSYNVSGTEKAYSYYNTTLNSIDFVFV